MDSIDSLFSDVAKAGSFNRFPDGTVDFFISSDFTVDCESVNLNGVLARGSYGVVYRGIWNGETYAVKIEDFTSGVEEQINLIVELTILQSLPHDRMVRFYGAGYQADSFGGPKSMILMELCENGTVRDILKHRPPWNLVVRLILDIARGIDFLHGENIVHRDIKTTNVLVDKDWRGKLCDFSFACHEDCFSKKEYTYGTDEFMSPEIALALDFDRSTDIFSFGITVCEAITCKEPSAQFLCRKAQSMFALNESELANAVMQGCPEELEALALQCCDLDTTKRPTIQTCIEELESIMSALGGEDFDFDLETHLSCRQVSEHTADSHSLAVNGVSLSHPRGGDGRSSGENNLYCHGANGFTAGGGGGGGRDSNEELDDRFALMAQQISDLRAENTRLGSDLRNLTMLITSRSEERFPHSDSFERGVIKPSRSLESNSDAASIRLQPQQQQQQQHVSDIILSENGSPRTHGNYTDRGLSVGWADRRSRRGSADSFDFDMTDPAGAGTGTGGGGGGGVQSTGTGTVLGTGTGKLSQALLLQQLENIQSQLDATKKELLGSVRKNSFSKPNPFFADNVRVFNGTPLSISTATGKQRSVSNHASPVAERHFNYPSSPSANVNYYTSSEPSIKRTVSGSGLVSGSGKWSHELKVDDEDVSNAENYDKLGGLTDNHFNHFGRLGSDIMDRKKKSSPHRNEDDSQNGIIAAANRCREMANRNPVNTDLSSALDKYLNVVRKLSASASTSTGRIDGQYTERAMGGRMSFGHSNGNSNGNSTGTSPMSKGTSPNDKGFNPAHKSNNLASVLHEFNRSPKPKDKDQQRDLTWRPSEGEKCPSEARYYLNSDEDPPSRSWITE